MDKVENFIFANWSADTTWLLLKTGPANPCKFALDLEPLLLGVEVVAFTFPHRQHLSIRLTEYWSQAVCHSPGNLPDVFEPG